MSIYILHTLKSIYTVYFGTPRFIGIHSSVSETGFSKILYSIVIAVGEFKAVTNIRQLPRRQY